jgi:hypothetical protein
LNDMDTHKFFSTLLPCLPTIDSVFSCIFKVYAISGEEADEKDKATTRAEENMELRNGTHTEETCDDVLFNINFAVPKVSGDLDTFNNCCCSRE